MRQINKALLMLPSFVAGGAERVLVIIANSLAERNIETTIVVYDTDSEFYKLADNIKLVRLNMPEVKRGGYKKYYRMPYNVKIVRSVVREADPDVVISFSYITNVMALLACKKIGKKVVISERTDPVRYNRLQRLFMSLLYKKADGFVYQTNAIKRRYSDKYGIKNSVVIYNPVTSDQIGERSKKEKIVLSVGRLIPEKNQELLIRAFATSEKLNEYSLHIYGDGPLKVQLQELIKNLNVENRVKLCGVELDPIKRHNEATVFALTSYVEGFPNVLIEAMANGIVCVASDIESGVVREIIQDGENGYLFRNRDVEDLRNKLEKAVACSAENKRIEVNAVKVIDVMNVDHIVDKWIDYIQK